MNEKFLKYIFWIVIAGFATSIFISAGILSELKSAPSGTGLVQDFGAIGTRAVENFIPVIKYNDGYFSNLAIQTTSTLQVTGAATLSSTLSVTGNSTFAGTAGFATTAPAHDFVVTGAATSTFSGDTTTATTSMFVYSSQALFGGQIILENPDGTTCSNIVLNDAGTALVVATITCPAE